jgi:hypothetical protein
MFENARRSIWRLKRRLVPPEEVAGIEITEAFARLVLLDPATLNIVTAAEVRIPAGSISAGRIISLANVEAALRALKSAAGPEFSHNPIAILSLPPALFFTHVLSLPDMPEENFEEAARLNAAQLSPIKISDAYFDWHNLGVNLETLERELFIALAPRDVIDPYLEAAQRAGIDIVAVEPWSLGLVRVFMYFASVVDKHAAFLITRVSSDGVDFVIAKEGKPFFSHFFFWRDIPEASGGKVTANAFRAVARRGIAKVSSFFATRYKEPLSNAALFTPVLQNELAAVLKNEFGMKVVGYRLPVLRGASLPETWTGVLGSALRGIIPRGEDTFVSLMPVGTEELFRRRQVVVYAAFWGKVFATAMILFTAVFAILFMFAANLRRNLVGTLAIQRRSESAIVAMELANRAREFNDLAARALEVESKELLFAEELRAILDSAGLEININQLSIFGNARQVRLVATASDRASAARFKMRLESSGKFREVDLPLALVRSVPEGVEFTITANIP